MSVRIRLSAKQNSPERGFSITSFFRWLIMEVVNPWMLLLQLHTERPDLDVSKIKIVDLQYPDFERSLLELQQPRKKLTEYSEFTYLRLRKGETREEGNRYSGCAADFSSLRIDSVQLDRSTGVTKIFSRRYA